ncbi:MAG: SRPBCC family protein [Balneolaceae bacterium]
MRPLIIEDTIYIETPKNLVWNVIENIEQWPQWTPTITDVHRLDDKPFGLGSKARIKQPGQPESIWTVTEYIPEEGFTWETKRRGLHMTAIHQVTQKESGTLNTLQILASGFYAVIFRFVLKAAIRRALMQENKGLKLRCEEG